MSFVLHIYRLLVIMRCTQIQVFVLRTVMAGFLMSRILVATQLPVSKKTKLSSIQWKPNRSQATEPGLQRNIDTCTVIELLPILYWEELTEIEDLLI